MRDKIKKKRFMAFAVGLLVLWGSTALASAWTTYSITITMTSETRASGVGKVMLSVRGAQDAQAALLAEDHSALSALLIEMLGEGKGSLEREGYVIEAELISLLDAAEGLFYGEEGSVYNLQVSDWPFSEETAPATVFLRAGEGVLWESIESYEVPLSDGGGEEETAAEPPAPAPEVETPKKEEAPKPTEAPKPAETPKQEETPKPTDAPKQETAPDAGDSAPAPDVPPDETAAPDEAQAPQSQQPVETDPQLAGETTETAPETTEPLEEEASEEEPAEEVPYAQVQFVDFDGFILSQLSIPVGETVDEPKDAPKHSGLKFEYWYNEEDGEEAPFSFGSATTGDITLKARYTAIIDPARAPEGTPEPAAQEEPDFETQLEEAGDESLANLIIKVDTVYGNNLKPGDPITLEGIVENLPGDRTARYQWQNNRSGDFEDIPGATGLSYTFTSTVENLQWKWRLIVALDSPEIAQN